MGEYNPQDGKRYPFLVGQRLTQKGQEMVDSFKRGGRSRYRSRNKKSRYNKYASVYKKQQSYKFKTRKRQ
jgi:hypothetical protein